MLHVKELEKNEEKRMRKNAFAISTELIERIDGAPVLDERIKAYLSEDITECFFFNQKYFMQYITVSNQAAKDKIDMNGSSYLSEILQFFNSHHKSGKFCVEFLKTSCKTEKKQCYFGDSSTTIPMKQIPHSCSDVQRPRHFIDVSIDVLMTPSHSSDVTEGSVEDS